VTRGRLAVVGTGPGPGYLTPRAEELLLASEVFVGGGGALTAAPAWGERLFVRGDLMTLMAQVGERLGAGLNVCILTSGDPGYFSLLAQVERAFPGEAVIEPGVASVQLLAARVGVPWQELRHFSVHGRPLEFEPPVDLPFGVLTGGDKTPAAVAGYLVDRGIKGRMAVGVSLGRPEEEVLVLPLSEAAGGAFGSPAAVIVAPETWLERGGWSFVPRRVPGASDPRDAASGEATGSAGAATPAAGIPDSAFLREEKVPLSRWEVRAVLAAVAQAAERRLIWDVGAGSGGFAVELARQAPSARVLAFERDSAGCRLIAGNAARFGARVEVVEGSAPEVLTDPLWGEAVDLCVVGGSGGHLEDVLELLAGRMAPGGRVVVTAVTLETLGTATRVLSGAPWTGFDALQLSSARLGRAGILQGMNPITILWADREAPWDKEAS
jgi:precorrin-6Y C5,15-methyltransferase (decarboxylating)